MRGFIETQSGRYLINITDQVLTREKLNWAEVFKLISETDELWRKWLFEAFTNSLNKYTSDVMSGFNKSGRHLNNDDFTFRIHDIYRQKSKQTDQLITNTKFRYLRRTTIFFDWMRERGLSDDAIDLTTRGHRHTRFPKNFDYVKVLRDLDQDQVKDLWKYLLLDPSTRIQLDDKSLAQSLTYKTNDLRQKATLAKHAKKTPETFLNELFYQAIDGDLDNDKESKHTYLRFLTIISSGNKIFLPANKLAETPAHFQFVYNGFMKVIACRHIAGPRCNELQAAMKYLQFAHKGQRQVRLVDFFIWFCAGNYGSSAKYAPEFLHLAQLATAGKKNNIRPYHNATCDFFELDQFEFKEWDAKLRARNSVGIHKTPLDLFTLPHQIVRRSMAPQIRSYEAKTKQKFPDSFDAKTLHWVSQLQNLIRRLPRKQLREVYDSARIWIMYLQTLPLSNKPNSFRDVQRNVHILGEHGYIKFLTANNLSTRSRLRLLHQMMTIWAQDQDDNPLLPIIPKQDWKNRPKEFRTKRKAIPTLIVETLIEENARACPDGIPYENYRRWVKKRGAGGNTLTFDGIPSDAMLPSVPAIIDCILHLGMRSSSARFLDSGEADEFHVDYDTVTTIPNNSDLSQKGIQNGFLQRMQVGPTDWVPSFLMLRNKTLSVHEIPFAPRDLVERLETLRSLQQKWNPIKTPVRAVDKDAFAQNIENAQLIFPLFRDPNSIDSKPASYSKIAHWWKELLHHCEPIVHEKRMRTVGECCDRIEFFNAAGLPVWDIHSIRVTVVTSLLEMGVSPTIVQHLVGHKSLLMTLHYEAMNTQKVHQTLSSKLEERRLAASQAIGNAHNEEELDDAIENILGGVASEISNGDYKLPSKRAFESHNQLKDGPGAFSVFSHGICPGGDCGQGGGKKGPFYLPVHRDKACSRCRFRITGPAFLGGLELNANILMNEISDSIHKEEILNNNLLELNRAKKPAAALESRIAQEQEFRDELWADWAAEYKTIRECIEISRPEGATSVPALPENIAVHFQEKGRLSMLQHLLDESAVVTGASFDLPAGLEKIRNEMLWDIAIESGDIAKYLITLPKKNRDKALSDFGRLLCDHADQNCTEPEDLIEEFNGAQALKKFWGEVLPVKKGDL